MFGVSGALDVRCVIGAIGALRDCGTLSGFGARELLVAVVPSVALVH